MTRSSIRGNASGTWSAVERDPAQWSITSDLDSAVSDFQDADGASLPLPDASLEKRAQGDGGESLDGP